VTKWVKEFKGSLIISVLLLIFSVVSMKMNVSQHGNIKALKGEVESLQGVAPETITIFKDKIVTVYEDGEVEEKYIPPEGSVEIDLSGLNRRKAENYRQILALRDSIATLLSRGPDIVDRVADKVFSAEAPGLEMAKPSEWKEFKMPPVKPLKKENIVVRAIKAPIAIVKYPVEKLLKIKKDSSRLINIRAKVVGFTLSPQFGIGYNGDYDVYLGTKLAFYGRYGVTAGTTTRQVGIGLTRRINDFVPFLKNTEAMVLYGYPYHDNGPRIFGGLSVNL